MAFWFKPDDSYMRLSLLFEIEHLLSENILNFAFCFLHHAALIPKQAIALFLLRTIEYLEIILDKKHIFCFSNDFVKIVLRKGKLSIAEFCISTLELLN
jgi:hypothetical protein